LITHWGTWVSQPCGKLKKNLQAFPDGVNDFSIDFLNIYANLGVLTFWMLSPFDK